VAVKMQVSLRNTHGCNRAGNKTRRKERLIQKNGGGSNISNKKRDINKGVNKVGNTEQYE